MGKERDECLLHLGATDLPSAKAFGFILSRREEFFLELRINLPLLRLVWGFCYRRTDCTTPCLRAAHVNLRLHPVLFLQSVEMVHRCVAPS